MAKQDRPTSLLLSDWAANVDHLRVTRAQFINQILVSSLLYDKILIQDELLALSLPIAKWFTTNEGSDLWRELIDTGAIVVLRHPETAYPNDELRDYSDRHPLAGRARQIQEFGTKDDQIFKPSEEQKRFYSLTEFALANHSSAMREVGLRRKLDIMPVFANVLRHALSDQYCQNWILATKSDLTATDLKKFSGLIDDPNQLVKKLEKKTKRAPKAIEIDGNYVLNRSLAYQAARFFDTNTRVSLQHVVQSAFALPFSWRENSVARYGGILSALPMIGSADLFYPHSSNALVSVEAAVSIDLPLPQHQKGLAKIFAEVRKTDACKNLRNEVRQLGAASSFETQKNAWREVAHELARRIAKPKVFHISVFALGHQLLHAALVGVIAHDLSWPLAHVATLHHLVEGMKSGTKHHAVALLLDSIPELCRAVGRQLELQKSCLSLEKAVDFRCTWLAQPPQIEPGSRANS